MVEPHRPVPMMKRAMGSVGIIEILVHTVERFVSVSVSAYASSKWAVRGLTKCAALELGRDNIRVNAVCPAGGSDEMIAPWRDPKSKDTSGYSDKRPLNRRCTVDEIAAMILYLASDESSFCTGGDYPIDGGHSCGSMLAGIPKR